MQYLHIKNKTNLEWIQFVTNNWIIPFTIYVVSTWVEKHTKTTNHLHEHRQLIAHTIIRLPT